jgi:hypothetical protein
MECGNFIPAFRLPGETYSDCTINSRRKLPFVIAARVELQFQRTPV